MLFYLDISPATCWDLDRALLSEVVSELTRAHRFGVHLAVVPRRTADWLLANVGFGPKERATLERLAQEYSQTGSLLDRARVYARIVSPTVGPPVAAGREIRVGIHSIAELGIFQKSVLIVEDIVSDGEIFQHILKAKRGSARLNNHEFEVHHGGGERIDQSALARILDERIVCVIVDSDMQSPSDGISEKVRRLSRVLQEADWAFAHVLVLPCRESENILTDDVFSALPVRFGKEHTLESLLAIEEQEALSNTEYSERFWLFFDMKRGIDVATLGDLAPSTKVWILGKLAMAGSPDTVEGFGERISASLLSSGDALGRLRAAVQTRRFDVVFGSVFDHALWVGLAARRQFA